MTDTEHTTPHVEAPVTAPPAQEIPMPQAAAVVEPATAPQVVYLKTPFYKLVWFWIALGLAAICLCLMAGSIGILIGSRGGRSVTMSRGNVPMRMQSPDGGAYYNTPGRRGFGSSGSLEATPTPNGGSRSPQNKKGSGTSVSPMANGGQTYTTPGPQGQTYTTPGTD